MGKWLAVLAAAGMLFLGATMASGFDPYNAGKDYCGPKLEAFHRTHPNTTPNRPIQDTNVNHALYGYDKWTPPKTTPKRPIQDIHFNKACYEHDRCYGLCSSNCLTRNMCDKDFRNRMRIHCASRDIAARSACYDMAETYYRAVQTTDGPIAYKCGNPPCKTSDTHPMGKPGADKVFFFEHSNFDGASAELNKGAGISDLRTWKTASGASWNERISSIRVGSGVRVLVYEDINFGGRCMTLQSGQDYPYLESMNAKLSGTENWSDRISSLKVTGPDGACPSPARPVEPPATKK